MGWSKLKSILLLVPAQLDPDLELGGVTAFHNYDEYTRQEMYDAADRWLKAHPGGIVMYDDDQLNPEVKKTQVREVNWKAEITVPYTVVDADVEQLSGRWKAIFEEALEEWYTYCEEVLEIPRAVVEGSYRVTNKE